MDFGRLALKEHKFSPKTGLKKRYACSLTAISQSGEKKSRLCKGGIRSWLLVVKPL